MLFQAYLKKTSYTIDVAENGEIAVEKFQQNKYDMVFMDIQMPVMDGFTATWEIREWENRNHEVRTPIIALTAHAMKEDMEKCFAAGCTSFLTKPIKKQQLLEAVMSFTTEKGSDSSI
jgi:CheY-like chemotaxis protein